MKKRLTILAVIFSVLFLIGACSNTGQSGSANSLEKTSTLSVTATSKQDSIATNGDIAVLGGGLRLTTAMLNIDYFSIEENSGFDGEQEGEHDNGDAEDIEENNGFDGEQEGEHDDGDVNEDTGAEDIILSGPVPIDISSGEYVLSPVEMYPGTFKRIDAVFAITDTDPFKGNSIVITGNFTPTGGDPIPFILNSQFTQEIQSRITDANGGIIVVSDNSTVSVVVTFDLAVWFNGLDFSSAESNNGIIIDGTYNKELLSKFETNLAQSGELEEIND